MSVQFRRLAALGVVVISLAACSGPAATTAPGGGIGTTGGTGATGSSSATPAGASSAPVVGTGGGGTDAQYCAALKVADAQVLVKPTIAAAQTGGPETCTFVLPGQAINGDNLTVTVFPTDSDKQFYNDQATGQASGSPNPVPGVGDVAVWEQPVAGQSTPFVVAHKGAMTCVVLPPADSSQLTIPGGNGDPVFAVNNADAAAYAAKEAALCTDLFALAG